MSERHIAFVKADEVVDIIVVDEDTGSGFADLIVAERGYDRYLDVELAGAVTIGQVFRQGKGYVAPVTVSVDRSSIPPDGATPATITYTDNRLNPPASIGADVNGAKVDVPLVGGVGTLAVTSANPGDVVTVALADRVIQIGVTV